MARKPASPAAAGAPARPTGGTPRKPPAKQAPATKAQDPRRLRYEDGGFLVVVLIVTVAFGLVVLPFFGAILWALVLAILFGAMNRRLLERAPGRTNGAALLTLVTITLIVILPTILLGVALIDEISSAYQRVRSGQIDIPALFERAMAALPGWLQQRLQASGWTDFTAARDSVAAGLSGSFKTLAGQALLLGQGTFNFVLMLSLTLYLTFFFLRDGDRLAARVIAAIPLEPAHREAIIQSFSLVIRATIKGSLVVAIVQGLIGGITLWALGVEGALLWSVMMGVFSLIPAIGTAIVWVPIAAYLLVTGAIAKGLILVFCGMFIIGMVDNILRPLLVGRDTRLPDYVVLISTLGGIQVFGINGFVIGPVVAVLFITTWNIFTGSRLGDELPAAAASDSAQEGT